MSDAIRWMSARKFRQGMKEGSIGEKDRVGIHVGFNAETQVIRSPGGDESRQMLFAISSEAVDRDTDTVAIDGWDLKNYRKNPVVLFGHNYWNNEAPVVGNSLSEFVANKKLKSLMEFTPQGVVPLADTLHGLYASGFMHATSVGFIANDYDFVEEDPNRPWGIDFLEQELLEYSLVPVPSNPEALSEARSKSIDTAPLCDWAEQILDEWKQHKSQSFWLPKSMIRELRKQADPKQRTTAQVPKGGEMHNQAAAMFVQVLTPELAAELVSCSITNTETEGSFTLPAGEYTWIGDKTFEFPDVDGLLVGAKLIEPLEFNASHWQIVLDKAAEAEPETKQTLLPCPSCGIEIQVLLVETDEDKSVACECGALSELAEVDGKHLLALIDADPADDTEPAWLVSLRASGAPEVAIEAAIRAHERGDKAARDVDAFELTGDLSALLELAGVDVEAELAKDTDAGSEPDDDSIDFEGIEVVNEDGTRCGLRDFFEQEILPESIDEGVRAAVNNVLPT